MNQNLELYHWGFTKEHWETVMFDKKTNQYVCEVYLKTNGGIIYYFNRYSEFSLNTLLDDAINGQYSPRPYQLAQPCDGTITAPVLALYYSYCKAKGYDPQLLHDKAYPLDKAEPLNFDDIILFARWQGVNIPVKWNSENSLKLLDSLTEINYHALVDILFETMSEIA